MEWIANETPVTAYAAKKNAKYMSNVLLDFNNTCGIWNKNRM